MIKTKKDLDYYLKQDRIALRVPEFNFRDSIKRLFFPLDIWEFEKTLRNAEYYNNTEPSNVIIKPIVMVLKFYYKYKLRKKSLQLGFSIPLNVFGPGLSIAHYGTIIVNASTRVGANCRLHACVNIGTSAGNKEAPIIGDNCYIGPGAILFGNITIANNVTIAANATVNKSCKKEYVVLAGTPAVIVKEKAQNWLSFNHIINEE